MSEIESPVELEPTKPSKLAKARDVVVTAGIIAIPTGLTVVAFVASFKMSSMQLETAKLNLEAARLNKQ